MNKNVIQNTEELSTTPLRADALRILEAGYRAVETEHVIREQIEMRGGDLCLKERTVCLGNYRRIFFVGIGKCAVDAGHVFEEILGDRITDGIILDVREGVFERLRARKGTHPFPSEENVSATKAIVKMLEGMTAEDLVLVVVSGGGSSLLCLPHDLACTTLAEITETLMRRGAAITELNTVRKHTSDIQGGQLAKAAYPATVVSFIFSDVPGDDMGVVASGPTVLDETTKEDAETILARYDILRVCKLPYCELIETPKEKKYFERVTNLLLVTNEKALAAMARQAEELGYRARIVDTKFQGEARIAGKKMAEAAIEPRTCLLYGGETTVTVEGSGAGGRNQELVLGALPYLPLHTLILAASSDGWDNTPVAGALADPELFDRAQEEKLVPNEFLARNDSYEFFSRIGGHIKTGRTGINVADLYYTLTA